MRVDQLNNQLLRLILAINYNANAYDDDLKDTWEVVLKEKRITDEMLNKYIDNSSYNDIIIKDWIGDVLFEGNYNSKKVDKVLNANKCKCKQCKAYRKGKGDDYCANSEHTGYSGDFSVQWSDENREDNVYEFINY